MDRLYELSGWEFMAEPSGWQRTIATDLSSALGLHATLVPRWKPDCVYGPDAGQTVATLPRERAGRLGAATHTGPTRPSRSLLVARRKLAGVWRPGGF